MQEAKINNVKNRFLPLSESVSKGLEAETKINNFNIIKELGSGAFGHVYLVTHKTTQAKYAIKAIDKRNKLNISEKPYFRREVEIMYKINHSNIVKLYGHFEDNNYCYFLMEYIPKGNLYSLIPKDNKKRINTKVVASIMKDIISGVYYLHNMNPPIIHRDIKPENILLNDCLMAKITDFGWSNFIEDGIKRTTMCGTPVYLAPEIISEKGHNEKVDIWCIGILLFELTTGYLPFKGNNLETLKNNILNLRISWPKDINLDAKNLIMKILKIEPESRIDLVDMIQHPFFTKYYKNPLQFLIKPEESIHFNIFLISKDNPNNWNFNLNDSKINHCNNAEKNKNFVLKNSENINDNNSNKIFDKKEIQESNFSDKKKFMELQEKYEKLKNDYDLLKDGKSPINEINELKNIFQEKEERIAELISIIKNVDNKDLESEDDTYLKIRCDELEKKNIYYKNKIERYKKFLDNTKNQNNIENRLKKIRSSMDENNKKDFNEEISILQSEIILETKINLNEIKKEKKKEIEKIKEEAKFRREKEKKKFSSIANKYDKKLTELEKENEKLKARLNELQG